MFIDVRSIKEPTRWRSCAARDNESSTLILRIFLIFYNSNFNDHHIALKIKSCSSSLEKGLKNIKKEHANFDETQP